MVIKTRHKYWDFNYKPQLGDRRIAEASAVLATKNMISTKRKHQQSGVRRWHLYCPPPWSCNEDIKPLTNYQKGGGLRSWNSCGCELIPNIDPTPQSASFNYTILQHGAGVMTFMHYFQGKSPATF